MPVISCLLATRNCHDYLKIAVESILQQTFTDFELIILVNGDKKNYEKIKESFKDPRIVIVYNSIQQLAHNLNIGLEMAKGEYIARMDDDDISDPGRFLAQINFLKANPNTIVVGTNCTFIDQNGSKTSESSYNVSPEEIENRLWYRSYLIHPSVMMRKKEIIEVGAYSGLISQDYGLWLRLSAKFPGGFYVLPDKLVSYRIHAGQERGRRAAYATGASLALYNFLLIKQFKWLLGAVVYSLKAMFSAKKRF